LEGDNQGAISAINNLRSPVKEINEVLQRIFRLCTENGFDVLAKWIPRDNLSHADALSRAPDPTDWALNATELSNVVRHFRVRPTMDLFASDVHHVADKFVSKFFTPGCMAVDATKQDWKRLSGAHDILWLFPPSRQVSLALSLLKASRVEALVCLPIREGSNELIQLRQLQGADVSSPYSIPRHTDSCNPSARSANWSTESSATAIRSGARFLVACSLRLF
jgi:hypothetical protein